MHVEQLAALNKKLIQQFINCWHELRR